MTNKKYPSDKLDKFMLRLPSGMREFIKYSSEVSDRSMNSEMVNRLAQSISASELHAYMNATDGDSDDYQELRTLLSKYGYRDTDDPYRENLSFNAMALLFERLQAQIIALEENSSQALNNQKELYDKVSELLTQINDKTEPPS